MRIQHMLLAFVALGCTCPPPKGGTTPVPSAPPDATPAHKAPEAPARVPAVAEDHPLYARVEGEGHNNTCSTDADCKIGGCSSEVCSAEEGVVTTCEVQDWPQKGAACGCVAGECLWYTSGAAGGPTTGALPGQGQPCKEGACEKGLTCVQYYGVAGPSGPSLSSCEIPCPTAETQCPEGQSCRTLADGPGRVCRPNAPAPEAAPGSPN